MTVKELDKKVDSLVAELDDMRNAIRKLSAQGNDAVKLIALLREDINKITHSIQGLQRSQAVQQTQVSRYE